MCDKRTLNKLNHPAALVALGVLQIAVGLLFILVNAANAADTLKIIWYIAGGLFVLTGVLSMFRAAMTFSKHGCAAPPLPV